ncbi:polyribonucleotide nucleotidyltransferase [Patescibacteria group bacterium]|nr:polyribonucleotide nucleotidyltransferase [Patescibacteria group bacterium]MBU2236242.1 polyribonucleotide nucleotidyltransferase [Patescibacteria group bacterium]
MNPKTSSSGVQTFETEIGGTKLSLETGRLAGQAHGSCTIQYGDTVVLATAVINPDYDEDRGFFPLTVDYEEKMYAAGKIKGSRFIKREGRPTDEAVLTARLIDRSIRPFFAEGMKHEVQVVLTVLSVDQENDPDFVSLLAASCALGISPIPWNGPIAGVKVVQVDGEWVLNPTYEVAEKSPFELLLVGIEDRVAMIEFEGKEVDEKTVEDAVNFGHEHIEGLMTFINDVQKKIGKEKMLLEYGEPNEEEKKEAEHVEEIVKKYTTENGSKVFAEKEKDAQKKAMQTLMDELEETLKEDNKVTKEGRVKGLKMVEGIIDDIACKKILEEGIRPDGRGVDDIRPLSAEVGILPRTHGTGLFNRGETQVLSVVTLGSPGDEQLLDGMEISGKKRYMHHYNFPGFSVGEVKRMMSANRREIGHGALAEKAIVPLLPDQEKFPYTIRVVSEVLSSNGSTSQASICGSSLALMDAGVPISSPAAGISIGLMANEDMSDYKLLTDIQGLEDHIGLMDFKVAGTRKGITAMQVDIKNNGLTLEVVKGALEKAKIARGKILDVIEQTIPAARSELSEYAPKIVPIQIDPDKIRDLIGPGGKIINEIIDETGVQIDIEDDGLVMVTADKDSKLDEALDWIKGVTSDPEVGEVYEGKVIKIVADRNSGKEIGALVELAHGKDGMVHISQLAHEHVNTVSDKLKVGDIAKVKVMGVDKERGRVELSIKALLQAPAGFEERSRDDHRGLRSNSGRGGDRPPRRRHN